MTDKDPENLVLGGARAWGMWLLAGLGFGYAFFHRVAPSVMVSELMTDFAIGGAVLGVLSALYFYPYVLLQVPLGAMLQIIGTRILLSLALMLAAIGSLIFGTAETVGLAYFGRILIGIGCSVGFLGSLALASSWFRENQYAFLAGLAMFFGMTSGMLAQKPLAFVIELTGWRDAMYMLAGGGALLSVLVYIFVRNSPVATPATSASKIGWRALALDLRAAFGCADVWKIAFVAAAMSGPMLALGALWGTPYAVQAYGLSRPDAAFQMSYLLMGWAAGAPFWGWASSRIGRPKLILVINASMLTALIAVIIAVPALPLVWFGITVCLVGFTGGGMSACFGLVRQVVPASLAGAATGVVNSLTVASGAVLQPLVGLGLDLLWSGQSEGGVRLYLASDYRIAFIVILLSCILGVVTALTLKE